MPSLFIDRTCSMKKELQSADAIEIHGVADFGLTKEDMFTEIDDDRPKYFCVFLHDKNGGTHDILDSSSYIHANKFAENIAKDRSLPIYKYVNQQVPEPCPRKRPCGVDVMDFDNMATEYFQWLQSRNLPEMNIKDLKSDAEYLLQESDLVYLKNFEKRWEQIDQPGLSNPGK